MGYHITGIISAFLYGLSVLGLWIQLQKIRERKHNPLITHPTAIISLNFMAMAFFAFFFLFTYGFALDHFNHYLVWPRLSAMVVSLLILYEMMQDRKELRSTFTFWLCSTSAFAGLLALIFFRDAAQILIPFSQTGIVAITITLAQANIHQILLIARSGSTGGIALRSHQLTMVKDLGTVAFGLALGTSAGWPLILLCGSNALMKLAIMYLFRWVRISPKAHARRETPMLTNAESSA